MYDCVFLFAGYALGARVVKGNLSTCTSSTMSGTIALMTKTLEPPISASIRPDKVFPFSLLRGVRLDTSSGGGWDGNGPLRYAADGGVPLLHRRFALKIHDARGAPKVFKKIMENQSEPLLAQPNLVMQHVGFTRHVVTPLSFGGVPCDNL